MLIRVLAVVVALALGWFWWKEHRRQVQARPPVNQVAAPAAAPAPAKEAAKAEGGAASAAEASGAAAESAESATNTAKSAQQAFSASAATAAQPSATQATTQGKTPSSAAAQSPAPPAAEQPAPEKKPEPPAEEKPAVDAEAPVQVTIAATEKSWIRVFSDQKEVETVTMDPDNPKTSRRSYSAQEKLKVVAGYPEGLTVTYNGKVAGDLGRDGQPITIIVTPSGLKTFLAKSP
jgi:cytoskeletal protein RodZ